ncbi:undecaprenyl-phosphate alpha-N-acetylglucosaminyl 1-phosphate transferase [Prolixibacter bellariivorans]|uniref:Undecaprenyl-phosphate alpha-N-acetylglucosaminyl 1-phosphate transferase n=1 Tax=Prolixibacter bellariivorans TaxID=314319 RepID=A0A5M4B0Z7_9BACT|nr:MraY family glycosyltransferase [Prolixibacter bellariivorans]GET33744.1 undecaprenyl-phosphate alpha-N-acetylglucosaminyl 1-phosphate transferase [Prolixibacter bellariivorans]
MNTLKEVIYLFVTFIMAAGLTYFSIPTLIKVARLKHLYDEPNHRSAATTIVPTLGGVAIYVGFIISMIIGSNGFMFSEIKYIIAALTIMLFIGLKDDIVEMAPKKKLLGQVLAALIVIILGNIRFTSLHGFLSIYEIPFLVSVPLTLFVMIVLINALNLIDGIDGLASGITILTSATFGGWFFATGHYAYAITAFALAGSLTSFFWFNVFGKENKIFMGDTGSLILGMIMSVLVIQFNEFNIGLSGIHAFRGAPAVSIGIMIIPLIDTLRVFVLRILRGTSPFTADRNHIHHKLLDLGMSHLQATLTILTVNLGFIVLSISLQNVPVGKAFMIIAPLAVLMSSLPSYLLRRKKIRETALRTYPD